MATWKEKEKRRVTSQSEDKGMIAEPNQSVDTGQSNVHWMYIQSAFNLLTPTQTLTINNINSYYLLEWMLHSAKYGLEAFAVLEYWMLW